MKTTKRNSFEINVRDLNPGICHASVCREGKEVAYCFICDDGLLVFVSPFLQANPPPPGLAEAIGQLVIDHCAALQIADEGGHSS